MDRRNALKNIALAFGCTIATPTLLQIVTSCANNTNTPNYLFLTPNEGDMVQRLTQTILPKIHFPLVESMNLTTFIDHMFFYTEKDAIKETFKLGCNQFENLFSLSENKKLESVSDADFMTTFKSYFNPENEEAVFNLINEDFNSLSTDKQSEFTIYTFLTKVRYYCLFGHATSEAYITESDF